MAGHEENIDIVSLQNVSLNLKNKELRARIAELEAERAELEKDRERSPSHSFAGILVWKGDYSYSYAITEHAINNGTCDPFKIALYEAMKAIDAAREGS